MYDIVIVGHRYAQVNVTNCLQMEEDSNIQFCSECSSTLPPECNDECPTGYTGINCERVITTTDSEVTAIGKLSCCKKCCKMNIYKLTEWLKSLINEVNW